MSAPLAVRAYCAAHRGAKRLLGRSIEPDLAFEYRYGAGGSDTPAADLWYGENETGRPRAEMGEPGRHVDSTAAFPTADAAWADLARRCAVPAGWLNSGLCNVCYARSVGQWCLSSWIWTSAAVARYAAAVGDTPTLVRIADAFLERQHEAGGWIVRNDYDRGRPAPMLAPNDSCYIAANALLPAYGATRDGRYLEAACACADWVVATALPSGLVSTGLDVSTGRWHNDAIIVDTGFTAALFAGLVEATGEGCAPYRDFLHTFVDAYIAAFRDPATGGFATSVDGSLRPSSGRFSRGQAWALEGLMPAQRVLGDSSLRTVIDDCVDHLLARQSADGGWPYDLSKPLMGQDCKGIPVIAKALAGWGAEAGRGDARESARRALAWCRRHTELEGECPGGIFSFCMEGAVTHYLYSEAAFVYSSVYALEAAALLDDREGGCR